MKCRLSVVVALTLIGGAPRVGAASDLLQSSQLIAAAPVSGAELSLSGCGPSPAGGVSPTVTTRSDHGLGRTVMTVLGRRVLVFGRFVPSTNIAAQMGALDPSVVATAMAMPNTRGYGDERPRRAKPTGPNVVQSPPTCASR
jgi:hypothetical protein